MPSFFEHKISVQVNTSAEKAMTILTDLQSYSNWTSLLSFQGLNKVRKGDRAKVTIHRERSNETFTGTFLEISDRHFAAEQVIIAPWFFRAIHFFEVNTLASNQIDFIQRWQFQGILSKVLRGQIPKALAGFHKMNSDFKLFLESQKSSS